MTFSSHSRPPPAPTIPRRHHPSPMASLTLKTRIFFLLCLSLISFKVQARLNLDPSDFEAVTLIQRDLGVNPQRRHSSVNPCSTIGIFCERRISNTSTALRVARIVFKSQRLAGFLSPAIGRLTELKELSLPDNHLVDRIPPQIGDCRKLEILNLKNNRFSGKIPVELPLLSRLRFLDLSSNKFSGNLSFLKHFRNIEYLSLAENLFTGEIPVSVRSFRNLRFYNYSANKIMKYSSFESLESDELPKRYILAENSTISSSPAMALTPSKNSSTAASPSPNKAPSPSAVPPKKKKNRKKLKAWILGFVAGALAGSIAALICCILFKLLLALIRGVREEPGIELFSSLIKKKEDLAFLEKEEGVASLEIIGRGGCGEVYKCELPGSNGKMIAIKKIVPPKENADLSEEDSKLLNKFMRQIRSEINTVGQIRHRNLLSLLAHVPRPDCHFLIYEFMKNGSLQDLLTEVSQGTRELDWLTRHRFALGVAAGLEYLHTGHSARIIHRDLKPANVLIDDDMEARIADFGLAKVVPDANTHVTTSNVAGTVGYISPEYHQTLKFTDKCDIYSFGVLLGVMVMGKLPSDEFFQHTREMSLVKWMRNVMTSENPEKAIDPKLMGNGYEEQMLLVLKIACFCTLEDPKQRPNSKDVRCMLSQINH